MNGRRGPSDTNVPDDAGPHVRERGQHELGDREQVGDAIRPSVDHDDPYLVPGLQGAVRHSKGLRARLDNDTTGRPLGQPPSEVFGRAPPLFNDVTGSGPHADLALFAPRIDGDVFNDQSASMCASSRAGGVSLSSRRSHRRSAPSSILIKPFRACTTSGFTALAGSAYSRSCSSIRNISIPFAPASAKNGVLSLPTVPTGIRPYLQETDACSCTRDHRGPQSRRPRFECSRSPEAALDRPYATLIERLVPLPTSSAPQSRDSRSRSDADSANQNQVDLGFESSSVDRPDSSIRREAASAMANWWSAIRSRANRNSNAASRSSEFRPPRRSRRARLRCSSGFAVRLCGLLNT